MESSRKVEGRAKVMMRKGRRSLTAALQLTPTKFRTLCFSDAGVGVSMASFPNVEILNYSCPCWPASILLCTFGRPLYKTYPEFKTH